MRTALFILIPVPSHYYATFGLARHLQETGFSIVYSGMPSSQSVIEREGFVYKPLRYIEEFKIDNPKVALGLFLKNLLAPAYAKRRYREYLQEVQAINNLVQDVKPDVVFVDDTMGHYYLYMPQHVQVIQVSTKLSPRKSPGIPPLNSFWQPKNRAVDYMVSELQWFWHIQKRKAKALVERIVFMGKDSWYFQKRYVNQAGIIQTQVFTEQAAFADSLYEKIPSIILAPFALEFPRQKPRINEHYLHITPVRDESHLLTEEYQKVLAKCLSKKRTENTRIIYVSLGTLSGNDLRRSMHFLQKTANALRALPSVQAIIATGGVPVHNPIVTANIHWLPKVPQLHLLPHCDLIITHGGLNTIKECATAGVPMLVYPLNKKVDQPGNAVRVAAHKVGLRGHIEDREASIQQKTLTVLNNPVYRMNCRQMQKSLCSEKEIEVISKILGNLIVSEAVLTS